MSDLTDPRPSPPESASAEPPAPIPPGVERGSPEREGRSASRVLPAIGFLLLVAFGAWLFTRERSLETRLARMEQAQNERASGDPARLTAFEDALRAETAHGGQLEKQLDALQVDVRRIDAASHTADAGALESRVKALEDKAAPTADVGSLEARLKALEDKPAAAPDAGLSGKVDAVTGQLDALGKKLAAAQTDAQAAQASAQAAQTGADAAKQGASAAEARANAVLTLAAATGALESGKPLGKIENGSPALARFATEAPPTEASLRLSFDAAAKAAEAASQPSTAGESFSQRMLTRAQSLVTVRQGDRVLVGAPVATTLSTARAKLQAGDLAGAVASLDQLDPEAAKAMAGWRGRAEALVEARAALASGKLGAP